MDTLIIDSLDNVPAVQEKTPVILPDGRRGFLHPSGSIKDGAGKFLVQHQPGAAPAFNRERGRAAAIKKEELRSLAIQAAVVQGTGAADLAGGVARLAAELVNIVVGEYAPRDKIKAFTELMRFGGLAYDLGRSNNDNSAVPGAPGMSQEAVKALNYLLPALEDRVKRGQEG